MSSMNLEIKLDNGAKVPQHGTENSAGFDISSYEELVLLPLTRCAIKTGIYMKIPKGYYGQIAPRSGLAFKNGIDVFAGIIDSDYRGEIKVILYNSDLIIPLNIKKGDRIAQLIILPYHNPEIKVVNELSESERGNKGFGSTGK